MRLARRVVFILFTMALLGTLAGTACWPSAEVLNAQTAGELLPLRTTADTRLINEFSIDSAAVAKLRAAYTTALPNEGSACLYGSLAENPGGYALRVDSIATPSEVIDPTPTSTNFACPPSKGFVGGFHTHPTADSTTLCVLSAIDVASLGNDANQYIMALVFCASHTGYVEFKDGRFFWLAW